MANDHVPMGVRPGADEKPSAADVPESAQGHALRLGVSGKWTLGSRPDANDDSLPFREVSGVAPVASPSLLARPALLAVRRLEAPLHTRARRGLRFEKLRFGAFPDGAIREQLLKHRALALPLRQSVLSFS